MLRDISELRFLRFPRCVAARQGKTLNTTGEPGKQHPHFVSYTKNHPTMTSAPKMKYVRLGKSGLKVSQIILGCMSYGDPKWSGNWVLGEEEATKHIKAAYDAGINTFDTADAYSNGLSEEVLGRAIKKLNLPRDEIVVMTKLFLAVSKNTSDVLYGDAALDSKGYVNQYGLSRKHIFDGVKHSLRRLGLDYIDVLQCHRFDPDTPIEETMQALHDVVKAGYVRYIGMSSCYAWQFHAMQNYAINNNLTPFISMQNQYSLVYREEEREMFPTLKHLGVGATPWSPLSRGALSRPLSQQTKRGESDALSANFYTQSAASQAIVNRVEEISKKRGISMAQVAIAWVLSKDGVSAPIVGTTSLANLADIIGAIHVQLSDKEIKYLEEPYEPMAIFGH
ncbi:Aldo/keto reductase [Mycena venus]|uniref:Aldo/keto reductase n=1 Tax=Mycena venus TaxID=2733690 RepID=A0A8H6Y3L1_9AGAR|nr:Aldo/keto reductase [Mycena venus]